MQIILLSGGVSSGKTTLSDELHRRFGLEVLKTKEVIKTLARKKLGRELEANRRAMQLFGEKLDRQTGGLILSHQSARERIGLVRRIV